MGKIVLTDHSSNGTYVIPEGAAQQFVKREGVSFADKAVISLGVGAEQNAQQLVRYRFLTGTFLEGDSEE